MEVLQTTGRPLDIGEIDDVTKDTWKYIRREHLILFMSVATISIVISLACAYLLYLSVINGATDTSGDMFFILLPLALPVVLYVYYYDKVQHLFIQQMAAAMGFTYSVRAPSNSVAGTFFSIGSSPVLRDVMLGTYKDRPVRVYSYQYTVGYGKNSHTYHDTVFEMDYGAPLPHVLMNLPELIAPSDVERVELEGNFDELFKLYVSRGQQMEIREIFQPDVMQDLISSFKSFSLEIYGTKLYLIRKIALKNKQVVTDLVSLVDHLLAEIIPELHAIAVPAAPTIPQPSAPLAQP